MFVTFVFFFVIGLFYQMKNIYSPHKSSQKNIFIYFVYISNVKVYSK